jgi:hypothetical protein
LKFVLAPAVAVVAAECIYFGVEGFRGNVALNVIMLMAGALSVAVIVGSLLQLRRARHP